MTFRFSVVVLAGCFLLLAGCQTGTITGHQQTCRSAGGFLERQEISCTGSAGRVNGSPSLGIVEVEDDLDGAYRLDATITVERGEARAFVTDAGGERVGGALGPDDPLRITATVEPDEDEDVDVALEVPEGERVENLSYEATLVPQE